MRDRGPATVNTGHIVLGDGAPVYLMGGGVHPPFNPRKESLRPGTIPVDGVERLMDGIFRDPRLLTAGWLDDFFQARDQVFCSRHHENIAVVVFGKALLGLARDAWKGELPAQAEEPIAIAGAVCKQSVGPKPLRPGDMARGIV